MKIHRNIKKKLGLKGEGTDLILKMLHFFVSKDQLIVVNMDMDGALSGAINRGLMEVSKKTSCTSGLLVGITDDGWEFMESYKREKVIKEIKQREVLIRQANKRNSLKPAKPLA